MGTLNKVAVMCGIGLVLIAAMLLSARMLNQTTAPSKPKVSRSETRRIEAGVPDIVFPVAWGGLINEDGTVRLPEQESPGESCQVISLDPFKNEQDSADCYEWEKSSYMLLGRADREGRLYSADRNYFCRLDADGEEYENFFLESSDEFGKSMSYILRDDGTIVFLNRDRELIALDSSFGEIWRNDSDLEAKLDMEMRYTNAYLEETYGKPTNEWPFYSRSRFYSCPDNSTLLARDAPTRGSDKYGWAAQYSSQGKQLWKREFLGDQLPIQGKDGRLYTLDYSTGMLMAYSAELEPLYQHFIKMVGYELFDDKHRYHPVRAVGGADGKVVLRLFLKERSYGKHRAVNFGSEIINNNCYAIVALNSDGSEHWRYGCSAKSTSHFLADDGTVYVVFEGDENNSYVLQLSADGRLLRRLNTGGSVGQLHLLDGGDRVALTLDILDGGVPEDHHKASHHLIVLDSELESVRSITFKSRDGELSGRWMRSLVGHDNKIYLSFKSYNAYSTYAIQL